jgi:hypothetical protein
MISSNNHILDQTINYLSMDYIFWFVTSNLSTRYSLLLLSNYKIIQWHVVELTIRFLLQDLETGSEDEYLKLLRAVIKGLTYPEKYFEELLRLAINKMGTDELALTRVVTTRAEVDLQRIAEEYQKRNSVPLDRAIDNDTSGDYQKFLLALLGRDE